MNNNINQCNYNEAIEDIYAEVINIIATNFDQSDPKELFDDLVQKYDEGTRRESEEAEKHIAFLCWLFHKAFMQVRLLAGLSYIPEEYSIGTGTAAPKLLSTIGKQITWKYYRKFPNYFETDIKIEKQQTVKSLLFILAELSQVNQNLSLIPFLSFRSAYVLRRASTGCILEALLAG